MATTLTSQGKDYVPHKMDHVNCPFCDDNHYNHHESFGPNYSYSYVKCKNCSLVYLNPRPSYDKDFLETAYSEYRMDDHHVKNKGQLSEEEKKQIKNYDATLNQLEKFYPKKGKILDLGCCTGLFLLAARNRGWETFGIEISEPMAKYIQDTHGIPTKSGQFHEMDLSDWGPFDVIYCSHVIEHIPNPNEWMQTFKKYLKKDGILILNIPNQYAPEKGVQRFLKRMGLKKNKWEGWRTPDHLYEPHIKPLKYLLAKNGFNLVDYFTYSTRETEKETLFHKKLKWGSKLRLFARHS
jgi:2-polyprenyl-3-methyl-5-hydroxy-6-metoxy-1,4-benzoquinol methylase